MKQIILLIIGLVLPSSLLAEPWRVLHNFGTPNDVAQPKAGFTTDGNALYGTTQGGPWDGSGQLVGSGGVFKMNFDGSDYTILHTFIDEAGGRYPLSGVVYGNGVLYGTTTAGGQNDSGAIFKVNTDGSDFSLIKSFAVPGSRHGASTNLEGVTPVGDLLLDGETLYGTASAGGFGNKGTLFKINTDGSGFTVLKHFSAPVFGTNTDGAKPYAGLTLRGSTLYGTTLNGGVYDNGVIFKVETNGSGFMILKDFPPLINGTNSDGAYLGGGLTLEGDTLYGGTRSGGNFASGTLFKLKTDGRDFVVLKHCSTNDGAFINAPPLLCGGALYGITYLGGASNGGVIYRVNTNGSHYKIIRSLDVAGGQRSVSDLLLQGSTIYSTAGGGGAAANGVAFAYDVPPEVSDPEIVSNQLSFTVSGIPNQSVVIEAADPLISSSWSPLVTNVLGDSPFRFNDPDWRNYPSRLYRVRTP